MNLDKETIINKLSMIQHPEGGYYSQTYRSPKNINGSILGINKSEYRPLSTSIYFMLSDNEVSHFHKLESDEIWYYHGGETLIVAVIDKDGKLVKHKLGLNISNGETPQLTVPAGSIFGSYIECGTGTSLVGCMVSFGFDFEDFKLYSRDELLSIYPNYSEIITKLTF